MPKLRREQYQPIYFQADNKAWYIYNEIVPLTYEPLTVDMILGNTGKAPKGSFDIVRVPMLSDALEAVCHEPGRVLAYLLKNRTYETNAVERTNAKISAATNVSTRTISRIIDALEAEGLVIQERGKIYIHPQMIHRGNSRREDTILKMYNEVLEEAKKRDGGTNNKEESENVV